MTLTFDQAATKLDQVAKAIPEAQQQALRKAGQVTKEIANSTGGRMRNIGRKGANLTAGYTVTKIQTSVKPRPAGAWHIAESGARPHIIGTGRGKKRKIGGYIYAAGYTHPVRAPIAHPGARGRLVWTRTVKEAERVVPPIFNQTVAAGTVRRIF